MEEKLIYLLLILVFCSVPAQAQIKLDTLLTTEGLTKSGNPITVKRVFNLREGQGVQFYVQWNSDGGQHDVAVRWFGPEDKLINFLYLANFSKNVVRDYISFKQETATQYFIPQQSGEYTIQFYLDHQLVSSTTFKLE